MSEENRIPVFTDDFDGDAEVSVHWEEDFVTVIVAEPGGDEPAPVALSPATARAVAREITLASFRAEGENTAALEADLRKLEDGDPDAPVEYTVTAQAAHMTTEDVYRTAKELAGPEASVGEVTDLARFLVRGE